MRLAFSISCSRFRFRSLLACFQSQSSERPLELPRGKTAPCWEAAEITVGSLERSSAGLRGRVLVCLCTPGFPMLRTVLLMLRQARCNVSRHDTRLFIAAIRACARWILRRSSLSCLFSSSSRSLPTPPLRRSVDAGGIQRRYIAGSSPLHRSTP